MSDLKRQDWIFRLANYVVMIGWALIVAMLFGHDVSQYILYGVAPLLVVAYLYYLSVSTRAERTQSEYGRPSFFSMRGVLSLLAEPNAVLATWMHILIFDMLIGYFITTSAMDQGISPWLVLPCLLMTLMFGPMGFMIYLIISLFH